MKTLIAAAVVSGLAFSANLVQAEPRYEDQFADTTTLIESDQPVPLKAGQRLVRVWSDIDPGVTAVAADTNVIYLNRCLGGCDVVRGNTDAAASPDRSSIVGSGSHTLSAFSRSDAVWNGVVQCMQQVFGPFNVVITDQDPGSAPHFEIMFGGTSRQLGMGDGIGGVSPATCATYIPNSLVFVFDVWGNDVDEICATAAQEIAHSWSLDHTTEASDPLTYFPFNGRRFYKDGAENCGSDCINGVLQGYGIPCTGPGQQTRSCICGGNTQNPTAEIKALFGDGTPTPPNVKITRPQTGDNVAPGFPINTEVTDLQGVQRVELFIDNQAVQTLTTGPYAFNAPSDLGNGTHTVKVVGYDVFGASGEATVQVVIGEPCGKPADCPNNTDTCIGGRCVPGPGVQGGLGSDCSAGQSCSSGICTATTEGSYCTESCQLGAGQCPSGFGCLDTGLNNGTGVCFPGFDDGTGGCSSGSGAPIGFGLAFAALLVVRRRKR